jgi:hypothetical protein
MLLWGVLAVVLLQLVGSGTSAFGFLAHLLGVQP